jgi:hypothetical protein
MMVLSAQRPDASLAEFLAHRARSAPIRQLKLSKCAEAKWGNAISG